MTAPAAGRQEFRYLQEPGCTPFGHDVDLVLVGVGADGTEQFASECRHCGEILALHF